jgi:tRNA dimethylallyltransferase
LILAGTTGAGKTALSLQLATLGVPIEIINCDSVQFYRGADIGSAKPTIKEREICPHHLFDLLAPDEPMDAARFAKECTLLIDDISKRGSLPVLVGGTGFYLKSLCHGVWAVGGKDSSVRDKLATLSISQLYDAYFRVDPEGAVNIGPSDRYRLIRALEIHQTSGMTRTQLRSKEKEDRGSKAAFSYRLLFLDRDASTLEDRLLRRTQEMLRLGWMDEVERLRRSYPNSPVLRAVGYREIVRHLDGVPPPGRKLDRSEQGLISEIVLATRQLVKRQRTYFKGQFPEAEFINLDQVTFDLGR